MKILKRGIIWIFILTASLACGVFLFISTNGKIMLEKILKDNIGQRVYIKSISYQIPASFIITDVNVDGLLQASEVYVYMDLVSVFKKKIIARNVVLKKPLINYISTKKTQPKQENVSVENPASENRSVEENGDKPLEFLIEALEIKNGEFSYIDLTQEDGLTSFKLEGLDVKAGNISLTDHSQRIDFALSGIFRKNQSALTNSRVVGNGWLNIFKKDMNASLTIVDEKERIGLKAFVVSKDNIMNVTGDLNYSQYQLKQAKAENRPGTDNFILGTLATLGVDIGASFKFETLMDDFKIDNVYFTGNVLTP